ncbi:hypothetical protein MBRA1_003434 [Malassezia brasiliensis]|uniref:Uncharacterized protein n=1 Tax=Malassezia brasiliensis TaxID=1821822 RepID=A0AAF0DVX7_9BASI|nr:hypothetical protein MBRA1_003434 [Malassezia brasiliensis]
MAEDAARRHVMLTELFGVHPRALVDALVVSANEHLYVLGERLEENVRALLGDAPDADRDAERGVHAVLTLMENVIDHIMDTFELYCMRSIFVITPAQSRRITLAHHRGLDLRTSEAPEAPAAPAEAAAPAEVVPGAEDRVRRQIASARAAQHRLAQAERAAKLRRERARAMQRAFAFLSEAPEGDAASLLASANAVRAAVPAVVAALQDVRHTDPLRAALVAPASARASGADVGRGEWEAGRDAYLNWETRRIVASAKRAQDAP